MASRGKSNLRRTTKRDDPAPEKTTTPPVGGVVAKRGTVLRFGAVFIVLMTVFYILSATDWWDGVLYVYLKANACLAHGLLNLAGQATTVDELVIRSSGYAIAVKRGCDAVEPAWLFCASVIAYPVAWRKKWLGLFTGAAIILAFNLVRIVSLYFLGRYSPSLFETAHLEIWPAAFILLAVALFSVWLRSTKRDATV